MATAKEIAYELIRNSIFSGKFQPGHQLKEEELAGLLNVSRTPVREALRQLADQGLIEIRANRRSYVADVTEAQFEELMDILSFLESYSAARAATRISKEELDELKQINAEIEKAVDDDPHFLQLNSRFHRAIHRAAGSHKLYELIDRIIDFHHNLYFKFGQIPARHNPLSVTEHQNIIEALEDGDEEYAALMMKAHTESVRRAFRHYWSERGKLPDTKSA